MDNTSNYIVCPNCHGKLREGEAKFQQVEGEPIFDMTCLKCSHRWRAHHRDFKRDISTDPLRNPFNPVNITPRF